MKDERGTKRKASEATMGDPSPSSGPNENKKKKTVRFNVGGTIYEVSRSLLEQHSDTMLARLASDTWSSGKKDNDSEALFIERDGERFKYCLDYMRDGGVVNLPSTISEEALLQDLEYYGFCDVDPSSISVNLSANNFVAFFRRLDALEEELEEEKSDLEKELQELEEKQEKRFVVKLALRCIEKIKSENELEFDVGYCGDDFEYFNHTVFPESSRRQKEFNRIFKPLRLKYKNFTHDTITLECV